MRSSSYDIDEVQEVNFTWDILDVTDNYLELQIRFEDPLLVSSGGHKDVLVIEIDLIGIDPTVTKPFVIQKQIPQQMTLDASSKALHSATQTAEQVTAAATTTSITRRRSDAARPWAQGETTARPRRT